MRRSSLQVWMALASVALVVLASGASLAISPALSPALQRWLYVLPTAARVELEQRQARWQALTPVERAVYGQRQLRWQSLPAEARREQRERWQAWRELPEGERALLRHSATAFAALPADRQRQLRAQFDALDGRERHGWLLGPTLGAEYPRLQPLLGFVAADERQPLLDTLRAMTPAERNDLAMLAQRTPPQARDALRRELLSTAAQQRGAWLRQRLDQ